MTPGITEVMGDVAKTAQSVEIDPTSSALPREAVLLLRQQLVTNVKENGGSYPVSISLENVWYVFSDEDTYVSVSSQAEADRRIDDLRTIKLSQS